LTAKPAKTYTGVMNNKPSPNYWRFFIWSRQSLFCAFVPLCIALLYTGPASAQTASSDEARLEQIERQIDALQAEVRAVRQRQQMSGQTASTAQPPAEGPRRYDGKDYKTVLPAPPPEECNWMGFYVGLNVGGAVYEPRITDRDYYAGNDTRTFEDIAFIGGGQIGYNWQINHLVLGLEVDGSGSTADVHIVNDYGTGSPPPFEYDNAKIDFLGTARARVGVAFQNALVYMTGGGAYAHGDWSHTYAGDHWNGEDSRWGVTGGVGLEYMLNCHWSLRAETLYTHLRDDVTQGVGSPSIVPLKYQFGDDLWSLRVGLNYKLGRLFGH
jgi:outer membrane immunogenic protein